MKKMLAFLMLFSFVVTSYVPQNARAETPLSVDSTVSTAVNQLEINFSGLSDPALLRYVEDSVYENLVHELNSDSFFVENVSAIYISKEYLDELAYNSQVNIYFGYTLAELAEQFQGTKFVFTLGENGQTVVQEFEQYDDTFDRVIRNVVIGTGVILLCVTVSVLTAGSAPAISVIFAASAKTGTIFSLSSGVFSGVVEGVVTGIQTKDFDKSLKAAMLAGSEGFKWGAISGTIHGGVSQAIALKGATLNGLTMNQAAAIQRETKYPLDIIKQFHTLEEAEFLTKSVGLRPVMLNGKTTLIRGDIDLSLVDELGRSNLQRMADKLNPLYLDVGGNLRSYEWHHIGQRANGTLGLLTQAEHDNPIIHGFLTRTEINRTVFNAERGAVNEAMSIFLQASGGL